MKGLKERYGEWALVTGATSGIGAALVDQLAAAGMNVFLVARNVDKLTQQASRVAEAHGVEVRTISADLSTEAGTRRVIDDVGDTEIGVFVPCAALESRGYFVQAPLESHRGLLYMDVVGQVEMIHHFGGLMAARRRGALLLVASLSGWMVQPYMAHYGAAKAFTASLGESLHSEMKDLGVDVTVLSPGPTDTPMAKATGMDFGKMGMSVMQPEAVAAVGLAALGRRAQAIPGVRNRAMLFFLTRLAPKGMAALMFKMMLKRELKIALPAAAGG